MLGFIRLESRQPLRVLPAGRRLIASRDASSPDFDLFLHQLLKWQYPSPSHREPDYRELFAVKPFLECLRLIRELGHLTKVELAVFGVTLIDYRAYGAIRDAIQTYRRGLAALATKGRRNEFTVETARAHFRRVYRDDIRAGRIGTREEGGAAQSVDEFVDKKIRNARDYADAAMRYFRATGLFYVRASPFHYHLRLLEERAAEVDRILETIPGTPRPYDDVEAYAAYLGDPDQPRLPDEEPAVLRRCISDLFGAVTAETKKAIGDEVAVAQALGSAPDLKAA